MAINLHLQHLSQMAANLDIRRFFINWDIPEGGVQIIGGPDGDAFVRFNNENDLLKAMALSGTALLGQTVTLRIISKIEMEALISKRKKELQIPDQEILNYHAIASHSGGHDHTGDSAYPNPFNQVQHDDKPFSKRQYNDSEDDDDLRHGQGYDGDWKRRKPSAAEGGTGTTGRFDRSNSGIPDGSNYDGYYQGQQQNYSQQRSGFSGRDNTSGNFGNRDHIDEPGYIMLANLGRSVAYKDVRELFRNYELIIKKGGIVLKLDTVRGTKIAFIQFSSVQDAINASNLRNISIQDRPVDIKRIRAHEYEQANSSSDDRHQMRNSDEMWGNFNTSGTNEALAGYIKIHNLIGSVRYKELREFFRTHDMMITQGGIILINDQNREFCSTAYIKFSNYQDALKADTLRHGNIHGQAIEMEMISSNQFEEQKTVAAENQESRSTAFDRNEFENRNRSSGQGSENQQRDIQPGYIRINNVIASIRYNELREFFRAYEMIIAKGGIILKNNNSDFSTAYVQFVNQHDALKADSTRYGRLQGHNIEMELISSNTFENQKAGRTDRFDQPKYDRYDQDQGRRDTSRNRNDYGSAVSKAAGFIQMRNVDRSVRYKELREFFRLQNMTITKGGIILPSEASRESTVYIKFLSEADAIRAESLNTRGLPGSNVHIQRISEKKFVYQESGQTGHGTTRQTSGVRRSEDTRTDTRQDKKDEYDSIYKPPGYIMLRNISGTVRYKELRAFFRVTDMSIAKGGIILKAQTTKVSTVYMKFNSLQDALRADSLNYRKLRADGMEVSVEMISPTIFEDQETAGAEDLNNSNISRTGQDKAHSRNFADTDIPSGANDKFEYFIHLDQLPGDATACEVWGWFDGPRGFSKGVRLVRRAKEAQAMFAYVAFDSAQHRNAAKIENEPCKAWSAKSTYRHLAQFGLQYEVLEATVTGIDRQMDAGARTELRKKHYFEALSSAPEVPSKPLIFTEMNERPNAVEGDGKFLCFLFLRDVPKEATASSIKSQYNNSVGGCKGVALVRRINGAAMFAYVAFEDVAHRNAAFGDGTRKFSTMNMYAHIAQFGPHCEIEESLSSKSNQILPTEQRDELRQTFFIDKVKVMQSIFSHTVARADADAPGIFSLYFLRLSAIPEDATACGMRKWLGGTNNTSKGAMVVRKIDPLEAIFAYVAFENRKDRMIALRECEDGLNLSVKDVCKHLAGFDSSYEILESTDSGEDREISEDKRETLQKRFLKCGEKDNPQKASKRKTDENSEKHVKKTKKIKVDPTDDSDSEDRKVAKGKKNMVKKSSNVVEMKKSPVKETEQDGEIGMKDESFEDDVAEEDVAEEDVAEEDVAEEDVAEEDVEDELTSNTKCTRRSTRRSFFEKQDEKVDESEDNDVDDAVLDTDED